MTTSAALALPIRSERVVLPATAPSSLAVPSGRPISTIPSDFQIIAALKPYTDYIVFRIPHRGITSSGSPDPTNPAYFRFLINPHTVRVSHQTQDTQLMTRDGWKFGVWGEGFVEVSFSGKTAGQYFTLGTTDMFKEFTESYQNLLELQSLFDNNGYWFEGETPAVGGTSTGQAIPMALTKRRIKMHEDVEIFCGETIWSGMFDKLNVSQNVDSPFLADFNISFTAWKERYRLDSPYRNAGACNIQRGHSYSAFASVANPSGQNTTLADADVDSGAATSLLTNIYTNTWLNGQPVPISAAQVSNSPALAAAAQQQTAPVVTPSLTAASTDCSDLLNPDPTFWNGGGGGGSLGPAVSYSGVTPVVSSKFSYLPIVSTAFPVQEGGINVK
jgi:hypothetical protein